MWSLQAGFTEATNEYSRQSLIDTRYKVYSDQNCMGTYTLTFSLNIFHREGDKAGLQLAKLAFFSGVESVLLLETLFLKLYFWCQSSFQYKEFNPYRLTKNFYLNTENYERNPLKSYFTSQKIFERSCWWAKITYTDVEVL